MKKIVLVLLDMALGLGQWLGKSKAQKMSGNMKKLVLVLLAMVIGLFLKGETE